MRSLMGRVTTSGSDSALSAGMDVPRVEREEGPSLPGSKQCLVWNPFEEVGAEGAMPTPFILFEGLRSVTLICVRG